MTYVHFVRSLILKYYEYRVASDSADICFQHSCLIESSPFSKRHSEEESVYSAYKKVILKKTFNRIVYYSNMTSYGILQPNVFFYLSPFLQEIWIASRKKDVNTTLDKIFCGITFLFFYYVGFRHPPLQITVHVTSPKRPALDCNYQKF